MKITDLAGPPLWGRERCAYPGSHRGRDYNGVQQPGDRPGCLEPGIDPEELGGSAWEAAITLFTGRSVLSSGMRQVLFGLAAALVTYLIGRLIGVSVAG